MKDVQGFELDNAVADSLNSGTVYVLGHVSRFGCAVFEGNPSCADDTTTIEQLLQIADTYGYFTLFTKRQAWYVIDESPKFRI